MASYAISSEACSRTVLDGPGTSIIDSNSFAFFSRFFLCLLLAFRIQLPNLPLVSRTRDRVLRAVPFRIQAYGLKLVGSLALAASPTILLSLPLLYPFFTLLYSSLA